MNTLVDDLILIISTYCDDKTNYYLSQVCKHTYNATKDGFIRHLSLHYLNNDVSSFTERFYRHRRSVKSCSMIYIENAFLWLPLWVESISMTNCSITKSINPNQKACTKRLRICSVGETTPITINWRKFPFLEEIKIVNHIINFEGMEDCRSLKRLCLYTHYDKEEDQQEIPQTISNLIKRNNSIRLPN